MATRSPIGLRRGRAMNYSITTADRTTHLMIVVIGLSWAIAVIALVLVLP
jgi:hypothetical protein